MRNNVKGLAILAGISCLAGCADMPLNSQAMHDMAAIAGVAPPVALSQADIAGGLRDALAQGVGQAIASLGRTNGFWGNTAVRVPLPPQLDGAAAKLRKFGLGQRVDDFQLALNRAAERATPQVAEIFSNAVRNMSLADARAILDGPPDAATQYFRRTTAAELTARIRPIVADSTRKVDVTEKYKEMMSSYGPLLQAAGVENTDLDGFVTAKTVDGLFYMIAAEEERIRRDPRARGTELMRRVFGSL